MGSFLIIAGFASALLSSVLYFISNGAGRERFTNYARLLYHGAAVFTISSAAFLMYLIISHQFQYTYVWNYSSSDLQWNLLYATFYAGQEGSFHLWAFLMAMLGIFLMPYLANRDLAAPEVGGVKDKFEPYVMGIFSLILSFLMFIMIVKSPYMLVWESFPGDVQFGFMPQDGRGLNPLLQNFWMSIHPPILFTGFTALSVPFCFAIAALLKNNYNRWMKLALPWTLFGSMILGLGIMLGGYWAYGVLGWGGYWAWDPVENSSFVPWLLIVGAVHTMIAEEKVGKYKKTSLILCILAYTTVLYSTFLTRSGVLGDASVHSFVDPGQEVYLFLIVFLSIFGAGGIGLIIFRAKSLRVEKSETQTNLLSRESALFVGAVTICASALVIAVGTSWPIFAQGTVEQDFYNRMNLPLAILIAAINGISILLRWKHSEEKQFFKSLYIPLAFTLAITAVLTAFGVHDVLMAVFAAASFFAFFVNAQIAVTIFTRNKAKAGAYIAHVGLMFLFLGIIGSTRYSVEENVLLPINQQTEALGYKFTYKGATPIQGDEEKYHFNVITEKDGKAFLMQPVMFYSEYSDGIMKNPDIANLLTKDLYLSPMSLEVPEEYKAEDVFLFKKGEEKEANGLMVKFIDFDRTKFNRENMTAENNIMGAELEVTIDGKKEKVIAEQFVSQTGNTNIPVQIPGNERYTFYLANMTIGEESAVQIAIVDNTVPKELTPETLILTASIKPFINLVWGGTVIMVVGFFLALVARYRRLRAETRQYQRIQANANGNGSNTNGNGVHTNGKLKEKDVTADEEI